MKNTSNLDEEEFLTSYDPKAYDPVAVTVDLNVFTIINDQLHVLLVKRGAHPFKGYLALPGGFVGSDENPHDAAIRELKEETNVELAHVEQLAAFGEPNRDPRMRVFSLAYLAFIPHTPTPQAGSDAQSATWVKVHEVKKEDLAFDHYEILQTALTRAKAKLEYTSLATVFCPNKFTLAQLQNVYEAVWGCELHKANFRRKVLSTQGFVTALDEKSSGRGRPATLYTAGDATGLHPAIIVPLKEENSSTDVDHEN